MFLRPSSVRFLSSLMMTLLVSCAALVAACGSSDEDLQTSTTSDSPSPTPSAAVAPTHSQPLTGDDLLAQVSARVPSFVGFYYDDQGRPTLSMLDASQADAAAQAIRDVFGQDYIQGSDIQVVQAENYSFSQLYYWYNQVWTHVLEIPGAFSTDIDEVKGKLAFEVETEDARSSVTAYLKQMNVPENAFEVQIGSPPVLD